MACSSCADLSELPVARTTIANTKATQEEPEYRFISENNLRIADLKFNSSLQSIGHGLDPI